MDSLRKLELGLPTGEENLDFTRRVQVAEPPNEVESKGRLSTGLCFATFVQLGEQLTVASEKYQEILRASPKSLDCSLRGLIESCRFAADKAERLLKANK